MIYKIKMWFHLMQKNFSENFSSVEVDDYTHEYLIRIPEWIINEMNWYDGTELNIKYRWRGDSSSHERE